MAECFRQIQDPRQPGKVDHCLHDVLMSGFAMMFFQDPSILAFQKRLQESAQQNNLSKVFGVASIPKDTQMRDVIDMLPTVALDDIFSDFLNRLQRGRQLDQYRFLNDKYLIPYAKIRAPTSPCLKFPNPTYLVGAYRTDQSQSRSLKFAALRSKPPAKCSFHYFTENCCSIAGPVAFI